MKKALLLCLFILFSSLQWACSTENDLSSLSNNTASAQEKELAGQWDLFNHYLELDLDSALYVAEEIKKLSTVENNEKWKAKSSEGIAYVHFNKGHFGEAVYHYLEAAKLFHEIGDLFRLADVYNSLGGQYSRIKDYETALSYFKKAKEIFDYEGSGVDKAMIHGNIAFCYRKLMLYSQAEDLLTSGIETAIKAKDYVSIAEHYNNWGAINFEQKRYAKAREYYQLSVQYSDSLKNGIRLKSIAYNNISESYFYEGNHQEAKVWLDKTLLLKKELGDPISAQYTYNLLGQLLIKEGKYSEAIAVLETGLQDIDSSVVDKAVGEGLTLITKALTKVSESKNVAQHPYLIEKFATYSASLSAFNNNLAGTKEQMEVISQQKAVQAAAERYAFNQQLEASQEANAHMRYAFLIPIFFLIVAIVSVYLAVKRNMHYKKLYSNIEHVLNNSKALRHLK